MKVIFQCILFLCFTFILCDEGMKTIEIETINSKLEVNENGIFTIKLVNQPTKKSFWKLVNKDSLNTTLIQYIKKEEASNADLRYQPIGGGRTILFYFQAGSASNETNKIEFLYQQTVRDIVNDVKKMIFEITIKQNEPKETKHIEVKANFPFMISIPKTIIDHTHFWDIKNSEQLNTSLISYTGKDEGRSKTNNRGRKKTTTPAASDVKFYFEAGDASDETVSIDFAEYNVNTHTYNKEITYVIKVIN